jgi:fibronectin-binding autotransporter adhesin
MRKLIVAAIVSSFGSNKHETSANIAVVGDTTIERSGGSYTQDLDLKGDISGSGNLTVTYNSGSTTRRLYINGANNTFSGNTEIQNGALVVGGTSSLPGWDTDGRYAVSSGAILGVRNAVSEADVGTMLGTTNFGDGALLGFDTEAGDRSYSANLGDTAQGALGLAKLGANKLTLTGSASYTGDTAIRDGVLEISGGGTLGVGSYAGA